MFFPVHFSFPKRLSILPSHGAKRYIAILSLYIVSVLIAIGCAYGLQRWSIKSLYALYDEEAVYISLTKMEKESISHIINTVLTDVKVREILDSMPNQKNEKFLNYILPTEYYALEIPMTPIGDIDDYHFLAHCYNPNLRKVIFTKVTGTGKEVKEILMGSVCKTPVLEVWFDLRQSKVIRVLCLSKYGAYERIPVPLF